MMPAGRRSSRAATLAEPQVARRALRWVIAMLAAAAAIPAPAAPKCTIVTAVGVAFGTYDVDSPTPLDSNGTLRLDCNGVATAVTVDLSRGNAPTYFPRYMQQGINQLNYNLYIDAAHTSVWGDATGGTARIGVFNPPNIIDLVVYGRIPAGQDLPPGNYTDTIVVTVNY